jgi:membrane protease YdiL (CAAX protease family)
LFRYSILSIVVFYVGTSIFYKKWTKQDLGVRKDTLIFWKPYLLCTAGAVLVIISVHKTLGMQKINWENVTLIKLVAISFLLSCIQEFLYRGYIFRLFEDISKHSWIIVIPNIIVFTYMHTIFPNWQVIIPLTAAGGILFALIYKRYPNFYLVSGMHFILNFTTLYLGFFPVDLLHIH